MGGSLGVSPTRARMLIPSGAFDRAARILALPTSTSKGPGAILEDFASRSVVQEEGKPLPIAFQYLSKDDLARPLAFSFAGLLAALERSVASMPLDEETQRQGARRFQEAAVTHLILQVSRAIARLPAEIKSSLGGLVVSGGVASNQYLRQSFVSPHVA